MKRCPSCNRTYTDLSLNFCLEDGTPLLAEVPASDLGATAPYTPVRHTNEPPPTEIYRPETPPSLSPPPPPRPIPPQWTPTPPPAPPRQKSNAIWWILGGFAALAIIGVGLVVMIIALASLNSATNDNNSNANANRIANRNTNTNTNTNTELPNRNVNISALPASFTDDFTEQKWGTGDSKFGKIWYADDEYHMSSKEKTYVVMYAPTDDYNTENATVKITARSVDGTVPSAGFGLMVHCAQTKTKQLEDYALLIYPAEQAQYEIVMHKGGSQTSIVSKTPSTAIRSGTNPNQLEVRIKGTELSFYVNGQYLTKITDTENYRNGRVGLYTSDTTDIAFDDLEIRR